MDVNFHYFTVKTLAVRAGFSDDDGEVIARYSQFVDDFTNYMYMILTDVPPYAQHLATKASSFWVFSPVTTGFDSWFDMARLGLEKYQKEITVPFHFIPPHKKLNEIVADNRSEWRVVPAHLDANSLIQGLLVDARKKFQNDEGNRVNLIRIGTLLHIFADTYAHQNFSGLHGWENYCNLKSVRDNIDGADITKDYNPAHYHSLPAIGHTEANHAPDDSNVSFEAELKFQKDGTYSFNYGRNNSNEFSIAAREIINYLSGCLGKAPLSESEWDALCAKLRQGFLTKDKAPALLKEHWKAIFPDIAYKYNKDELMNIMLEKQTRLEANSLENTRLLNLLAANNMEVDLTIYKTKSDDFFRYNVIADEIRTFVNGKVRSIGEENMLSIKEYLKA